MNEGIDLSPEEFRALATRAIDLVAEHLAAQRAGPVRRPVPAAVRKAFVDEPLPLRGKPPEECLARLRETLFRHPMGNSSPRFFGWVNSSAAPAAIVAELVAAGLNPSVAGGDHAATYVEHAVLRWMKELLGLSAAGGALLTSGGSVANLIGLAAMRHRATRGEVRKQGLAGMERLRVYASGAEHSCIQKAVELLGIGSANLVRVGLDRERRIDLAAAKRAIAADRAAGLRPACIVGSAGTVDVGAIDPLAEMAALAREEGLWFHVDAAYGGPAYLAPELRPLFDGLDAADSVAVDPHKWMYVPVECGFACVKDRALLRDTFSHVPPYLRDDSSEAWFSEFGIQQTRGFRALKLWLALQTIGVEGYRASIERDLALARGLVSRIRAADDLELLAAGPLSIACFRYAPAAARGDERALENLNRALLPLLQAGGEAFLTATELDGRFALRACIVNFRTEEADLDALLAAVRRAGSRVLASGRGGS